MPPTDQAESPLGGMLRTRQTFLDGLVEKRPRVGKPAEMHVGSAEYKPLGRVPTQ